MRVKLSPISGGPAEAVELVGYHLDEHGDLVAVVRHDHEPTLLEIVHRSRIKPLPTEDEEVDIMCRAYLRALSNAPTRTLGDAMREVLRALRA